MRTLIFALILLSLSASAETRWIVMRSSNFEVYSSAGERATRETLRHFEQVRSFFQQAAPDAGSPQFLIRVVVFADRRDYQAIQLKDFAAAFYQPGRLREYIVIGNTATQAFPVAVHEYVHLLAKQSGLKFPPWLNEGLAELYSSLEPVGNQIVVGKVIPNRWMALQREKWVPLETILSAGRDSPYYNEKNKASSLYNEGWALTHMLMLSDEYRAGATRLLSEIQAGTPSDAALSKIYGKRVSEIEKELQGYLRQRTLQGAVFDAKLEKLAVRPEPIQASDLDVKLILAELGDGRRSPAENRSVYEALLTQDPSRPEPHALLGYAAWQDGRHKEAGESFANAFKLGERNPKLLWDLGRLGLASNPKTAAAALDELLRLQPDRADVRAELAWAQLQFADPAVALGTLAPVKKLEAAHAVRFFEVFAHANYRSGNLAEARKAAARMTELAKEEPDQLRAQRLTSFLDVNAEGAGRTLPPPVSLPAEQQTLSERPTIRRTQPTPGPPEETVAVPSPDPEVRGTLVGLNCSAKPPTITVESEGRNYALLLDQPEKVVLVGSPSGKIDLNCGPQRPRPVRVAYNPVDAKTGAAGSVKLLEFVTER